MRRPTYDELLRDMAWRYAPCQPPRVRIHARFGSEHVTPNRHDRHRWVRRAWPAFAVAFDALETGRRDLAIATLCDVVCLQDAIELVTPLPPLRISDKLARVEQTSADKLMLDVGALSPDDISTEFPATGDDQADALMYAMSAILSSMDVSKAKDQELAALADLTGTARAYKSIDSGAIRDAWSNLKTKPK